MPIEIKELHIKAVIQAQKEKPKQIPADLKKMRAQIVRECVQEVIQKLNDKTER